MSSHRTRTKRKTLTWQGTGVLLAAGAVGLFILPVASWIRPAQADWDGAGVRTVASAGGETDPLAMSLAEAEGMGSILDRLSPPKPEIQEEPKPEPPIGDQGSPLGQEPPKPAPPPTGTKANWVYLGSAVTPRASRALVRIDQSQKFVRQGAEIDGIKLLEVHDDHIVVEEKGMQKHIERAEMIANAMLAPPKGPAGAAASRAGAPTPPMPTPPAGSAAAALAAAQAAHGKAPKSGGPNTPGRLVARVMQLSPEMRAQVFTAMTSPTASYEDKIKAISELGFDPDALLAERQEAMRALGINPDDPDVLRILEDEMNGAARKDR